MSCDKVFKNGPSEIYERQPLKNFTCSILEYFVPVNPSIEYWNLDNQSEFIPETLKYWNHEKLDWCQATVES